MKVYDIALTYAISSSDTLTHLTDTFGSAKDVFDATPEELSARAQLSEKIILRLSDKKLLFQRAEKEIEFCEKFKINVLVKQSDNYPQNLEICRDSSHVLYSKGDIDFNAYTDKWVAVVGTRKCSSLGQYYCEKIIREIAETYPETVIVSGLAYGIDSVAHRTAIKYGLKTVAFMAHGLDMIYPAQNRTLATQIIDGGGAIVTEYPMTTKPLPGNFLARNRLVAGVSSATIVVETPYKGGAISTANIADGYSRELFAMVGRSTDESFSGCNKLIKSNKANMLEDIKDLEYVMGWQKQKSKTSAKFTLSLTDDEQKIYDCFDFGDEITVDEIVERTGFSASECLLILTTLELNDIIKQVKGMLYIKLK